MEDISNRRLERLTALWALSEAGLGGLMHAMKTPFTGIVVGGTAIMCIAMIAYFSENRIRAILKAAMIVLIVKAAVSPHSPLPAYVAVAFQTLAGVVLFGLISKFRIAALMLGIAGLLETSLQKVITLTILYGMSIWESIDMFFDHAVRWFGITAFNPDFSISYWLIILYVSIYTVAGIAIGWIAGILPPAIIDFMKSPAAARHVELWNAGLDTETEKRGKPFWKRGIVGILFPLAIIIAVFTYLAPAANGGVRGLYVVLRTIGVLLLWYIVVSPLAMKVVLRFLKQKRTRYGHEVDTILFQLPALKKNAAMLWDETKGKKGLQGWWQFLLAMTAFALTFNSIQRHRTAIREKETHACF